MTLEVREPGLLTTVQDAGRPGLGHLGVPRGGAVDPLGLAIANLVCGNEPGAAAFEMTIAGPVLVARESLVVGLAGADLGGVVRPAGRRLLSGRSHRLAAGEVVAFPGPEDPGAAGRAYLALPGGVDVPVVLGSRSTCLAAGFGGHEGRSLLPGDVLRAARRDDERGEAIWPEAERSEAAATEPDDGVTVRVLPGPGLDVLGAAAFDAFCAATWTVAADSDRMGLRLTGATLPRRRGAAEILSHGVTWGSVQVPPDGSPIVLLADHQPTGGYPVLAVAIAADRPTLGQLVPGHRVSFAAVGLDDARRALAEQRRRLLAGAAGLTDARRWTEAAEWAGG